MKKVLCSAALVLVTAGWGYAGTITATYDFGIWGSYDKTRSNITNSFFNVAQYNGAETLLSIDFTLYGEIKDNLTISPDEDGSPFSWTDAGTRATMSSANSAGVSFTLTIYPTTSSSSVGTFTTPQNITKYANATTGVLTYSDALLLAAFTGTGVVIFDNYMSTSVWGTFTDTGSQTTSATGDLHLTVAYNYVDPPPAVPEPATMLLFGTGLLGLAGVARRRVM